MEERPKREEKADSETRKRGSARSIQDPEDDRLQKFVLSQSCLKNCKVNR